MLRRIKKLLEHNTLTIAIIATLVIAILSLSIVPKLNIDLKIESGDKYLHALAYFVLSIIWYFALQEKIKKPIFKIVLITVLIFYGIILEALQGGITNYRTADFYDIVANTIGIIFATLLFNRFIRWFNTI